MALAADIAFNSKEWQDILKDLRGKWNDLEARKTFGGIISTAVYQDIMEHFQKEEGPDAAWKQWSDGYLMALRRIGRAGNMKLQFSGKLRQSFMPQNYRSTAIGIVFYNNAKTKTGFPYAAAHDEGGPKLPQREFMWLSDKGMNNIVDRTLKWLLEK